VNLISGIVYYLFFKLFAASFDHLIPENWIETGPKDVYLESYFPSYSILLPLANNSSSSRVSLVHPNGEFTVHAPPDFGIMVVVQALRLRTSVLYSDKEETTFLKCRDYLRVTFLLHLSRYFEKKIHLFLNGFMVPV